MHVINGKYNHALVMIDKEYLDEKTKEQIQGFVNSPVFSKTHIAIMADTHFGAGTCIGFTMKMNDYVIPNVVGVDIGCGVLTQCLGRIDIDFQKLDDYIRKNIPHGNDCRSSLHPQVTRDSEIYRAIKHVSSEIRQDSSRYLKSLGTLGGGNHFIEINKDNNENLWLSVHSGSRKFGYDIAEYHQEEAKKLMAKMFLGDSFKHLEFLPIDIGGKTYLNHMRIAQNYANINRLLIVHDIARDALGVGINTSESIHSVHNYISFEDNIIRKGAISAHEGELLIIPLNMRDGSIIARGKGSAKWNFSAPHGAGRILSRKKAIAELSIDEYKKEMEGIWTTSISEKTLDEAPMAYKDMQLILDATEETIDIEQIIKPVYNFKSSK